MHPILLVAGVLVVMVHPGSEAERAGILPGDVIVEYNDLEITTMTAFQNVVLETRRSLSDDPQARVPMSILRDGELIHLQVRPGKIGIIMAPASSVDVKELLRRYRRKEDFSEWKRLVSDFLVAAPQDVQPISDRARAWIEAHGLEYGMGWVYDFVILPYLGMALEGSDRVPETRAGVALAARALESAETPPFPRWREWLERVLAYETEELQSWLAARRETEEGAARAKEYLYHEATELLRRAFEGYRETNDPYGLRITLLCLGNVAYAEGRSEEALSLWLEALEIIQRLGDREGLLAVWKDLGAFAIAQGRYEETLTYYEQALGMAKELASERDQAVIFGDMGWATLQQGEYDRALQYLRREYEMAKRLGHRSLMAEALGGRAAVELNQGKPDRARRTYLRCISLAEQAGHAGLQVCGLHDLGALEVAVGNYEEALSYLGRSASLCEELGLLSHLANALQSVGEASLRLERWDEAIEAGEQALAIRMALRGELADPESRLAARVSCLRDPSSVLVAAWLGKGEPGEALLALERGRAVASRSIVEEAKADLRKHVPPALIQEERALLQNLQQLPDQVAAAEDESERARLRKQLYDYQNQLRVVSRKMREANPAVGTLSVEGLESLETVARSLPEGTYYLTWHLGEYARVAFLLGPDGTVQVAEMADEPVRTAQALRSGAANPAVPASQLDRLVKRLRNSLLSLGDQDIERLTSARRIVLAPPAEFAALPFALLFPSDTEIVLTPGMMAWNIPDERERPARFKAIVLGDPREPDRQVTGNDEESYSLRPPSAARTPPAALPSAGEEARRIADLLRKEGHDVRLAVGTNATERWLKKAFRESAETISHLHLAAHGVTDTPRAWHAYLHLAGESDEDGRWTFREIFRERLPELRLVVLSACDTALGESVPHEGMMGLVRAFHLIGAKEVVGTLWPVEDEATALLMERFYEKLLEGREAAQALREAQTFLRRSEKWSHPYYWAGFVVYSRRATQL